MSSCGFQLWSQPHLISTCPRWWIKAEWMALTSPGVCSLSTLHGSAPLAAWKLRSWPLNNDKAPHIPARQHQWPSISKVSLRPLTTSVVRAEKGIWQGKHEKATCQLKLLASHSLFIYSMCIITWRIREHVHKKQYKRIKTEKKLVMVN